MLNAASDASSYCVLLHHNGKVTAVAQYYCLSCGNKHILCMFTDTYKNEIMRQSK
jgi:hypothetical protein